MNADSSKFNRINSIENNLLDKIINKSESLQKVIKVADEALLYIHKPDQMIKARKQNWLMPLPVYKSITWCFALTTLIGSLYIYSFGSPFHNLTSPKSKDILSYHYKKPSPVFVALIINLPIGYIDFTASGYEIFDPDKDVIKFTAFGYEFLEKDKDFLTPQLTIFTVGFSYIVIDNIIPQELFAGSYPVFFIFFFGLITVLCIHPIARLFGGKESFINSVRTTSLFYGYTFTVSAILFFTGLILFINTYQGNNPIAFGLVLAFCLIPFLIIFLRGFYKVLLNLYNFTKLRLTIVLIGALIINTFVSPIYLYFGIYGTLKLKDLLDILFYSFLFVF